MTSMQSPMLTTPSDRAGGGAPVYTFVFADLMTDAVLAELPLSGVSFEKRLNGAGTLSATLALGDPRLDKLDVRGSTQPGRTAIYVDRDGVLVWGGILWTRVPSSNHTLQLQGAEFWSWFQSKRFVPQGRNYTGMDQIQIVLDVFNFALPAGNIGIGVPVVPNSGVVQSPASDNPTQYIGEFVERLASAVNGFDFAIDLAYAAGVPTKTLNFAYPRRGQRYLDSVLMFELPGNITDYSWPEDATKMATDMLGTGAGTGTLQLLSRASLPGLRDAGYPLLEGSVSANETTDQGTLDSFTWAAQFAAGGPVTIPELTVRADMDPPLGGYIVGDEFRVRIEDDWFTEGLDSFGRIIGYTVTPGDGAPESVKLTCGAVL